MATATQITIRPPETDFPAASTRINTRTIATPINIQIDTLISIQIDTRVIVILWTGTRMIVTPVLGTGTQQIVILVRVTAILRQVIGTPAIDTLRATGILEIGIQQVTGTRWVEIVILWVEIAILWVEIAIQSLEIATR